MGNENRWWHEIGGEDRAEQLGAITSMVVPLLLTVLLIGAAGTAVGAAAGWWARGVWSPEPCYAVVPVTTLVPFSRDEDHFMVLVNHCTGDTWMSGSGFGEWSTKSGPPDPPTSD